MKYQFEIKEKIEYCSQCPCYNDDGTRCMLGYSEITADDKKPWYCQLREVDEQL